MPNFVVTTKQIGTIAVALAAGVWAVFYFINSPMRDDIGIISGRIDALVDPMTGYPKVVPDAVAEGLKQAMREDEAVKVAVNAKVDAELQKLIAHNTAALAAIRTELVARTWLSLLVARFNPTHWMPLPSTEDL